MTDWDLLMVRFISLPRVFSVKKKEVFNVNKKGQSHFQFHGTVKLLKNLYQTESYVCKLVIFLQNIQVQTCSCPFLQYFHTLFWG